MENGEYLKMMQTVTRRKAEEIFNGTISEIPPKNDIILIHEALKKYADYDCEMIFLNEPENITCLTDRMGRCNLVVRCDEAYVPDDIESNDMLMIVDDDDVMLFDYRHYIESVSELELTDSQYEDMLAFCSEHEVVDEGNAFYIKNEHEEKRKKLYEVNA
jgi:hypothetical protein